MRAPLPGGELSAFLGEGECEAAVLVTADASCGVPREEIAAEEEKLAARLSARGVPAVLALCSRSPASDECAALAAALKSVSKFLMVAALAAIGLNTDFKTLCKSGAKPMLHGFIISLLVVLVAIGVEYLIGVAPNGTLG